MHPIVARALCAGMLAGFATTLFSAPAAADAPIWANAKWVKATATTCGNVQYLLLKGNGVTAPTRSNTPGCRSAETVFVQVNVSKKFFRGGNGSEVSASHVDAGFLDCGEDKGVIILGAPGEAVRAMREHPAPRGCRYTTRQYQYLSSMGRIPFTNVANGGRMSVRESLALHARERERAIAECNASAACRAEVARMRSFSGSGPTSNPCIDGGNYSTYNGAGRCTDSNGNLDPRGGIVQPR